MGDAGFMKAEGAGIRGSVLDPGKERDQWLVTFT